MPRAGRAEHLIPRDAIVRMSIVIGDSTIEFGFLLVSQANWRIRFRFIDFLPNGFGEPQTITFIKRSYRDTDGVQRFTVSHWLLRRNCTVVILVKRPATVNHFTVATRLAIYSRTTGTLLAAASFSARALSAATNGSIAYQYISGKF